MYPGMIGWWKHAHRHGHGHHGHHDERQGAVDCTGGPGEERAGRGRGGHGWGPWGDEGVDRLREVFASHERHDHDGPFGGFGVRRPLRFLAYKLELEEAQVETLASILNDLKTERAQGEVDQRRSTAAIAEAISADTLDGAKLAAATDDRVRSAERLRDAVVKAIGRIHAMLTAEQRSRFAYLIRTGALSI